jgi:hypothetical protein
MSLNTLSSYFVLLQMFEKYGIITKYFFQNAK